MLKTFQMGEISKQFIKLPTYMLEIWIESKWQENIKECFSSS